MTTTQSEDEPVTPAATREHEQQASAPVIAVTDTDATATIAPDLVDGTMPILPLMGLVVFPGTVVPLTLGRPSALRLVDECLPQTKVIGLLTQRNEDAEKPSPADLYNMGVTCQVLKMMRQPDGTVVLLIQALNRFRVTRFTQTEPFVRAEIETPRSIDPAEDDKEATAAFNNLRDSALQLMELMPDIPEQARLVILNVHEPARLTDLLAGNLGLDIAHKQDLLEETNVIKRMALVQESISRQIEIGTLQQKLRKDVEGQFSDSQRRAYLREQVRAIQRELGETEGADEQIDDLRERLEEAGLPEPVMKQAERELKRLASVPPSSPEYSVIVSYTETLAELPWNKMSEDNLDLDEAQRILDRDHYGLEKIKSRLIEYLAVRKLNPGGRGPILCFLGPPGVGKTSLGQSIADALGRKFARLSLGGIRDEAEIRGHRRTYVGAMPGRLIQELRRVGTRNPVLMLDEVDKLGADNRGDPASALLEVLDPRQNNAFVDRYLDVPFDLSQVIFIATANYQEGIPAPLQDRMETLRLPGYTEEEKLHIAENYLVRRQREENGLQPEQCVFQARSIARDYFRVHP